jgi:hypothetical protein
MSLASVRAEPGWVHIFRMFVREMDAAQEMIARPYHALLRPSGGNTWAGEKGDAPGQQRDREIKAIAILPLSTSSLLPA